MKNGNDRGFLYSNLNYKARFKRTLFLSPFTLGLIIFMFVTEAVTLTTGLILTVILVSVTILQLLDTHRKWKREEANDGEG